MIKHYLPWILVLIAFTLGWLVSPKPDKELEKRYKAERKELQRIISQQNWKIATLNKAQEEIREKRYSDSAYYSGVLKAKEIDIVRLKTKASKVDYKNFSDSELDSVRRVILSSAR